MLNKIKKLYQNIYFKFTFGGWGHLPYLENSELINNPKNIYIGDRVYLKSGNRLESLNGGKIFIGSGTQAEKDLAVLSASEIKIGSGCMFARNVWIADHYHNIKNPDKSPVHSGLDNILPISIGDNCWVGTNVVILPGSRIGNGCTIGANTIVKGEFPNYSMVVGSPCRIVKLFNKKRHLWDSV